jgi:hypothetical protein
LDTLYDVAYEQAMLELVGFCSEPAQPYDVGDDVSGDDVGDDVGNDVGGDDVGDDVGNDVGGDDVGENVGGNDGGHDIGGVVTAM